MSTTIQLLLSCSKTTTIIQQLLISNSSYIPTIVKMKDHFYNREVLKMY